MSLVLGESHQETVTLVGCTGALKCRFTSHTDRTTNVNSYSLRSRSSFCSCDEGSELLELLQAPSSCPEVPGQSHHERAQPELGGSVREDLLVSKAAQSRFPPALRKTALSTAGDLKDSKIFVLHMSFLAIPPKR